MVVIAILNKFSHKIFLSSLILILCFIINIPNAYSQKNKESNKKENNYQNWVEEGYSIAKDKYSIKGTVPLVDGRVLLVTEKTVKDEIGAFQEFEAYTLNILTPDVRFIFLPVEFDVKTSSFNSNCPADGFRGIVVKGNYFTIEDSFCAGWLFVNSYTTFKYNKSKKTYELYKYSEEYLDRSDPDKDIPTEHFPVPDNIYFWMVTQDFLSDLRN